MILRLWRGWTTHDNAAKYQALLKDEIMPGIRAQEIPGLLRHQCLKRTLEDEVEHMTLLWFDKIESVSGFDGTDYAKANIPASAAAVLSRWDERVVHYDVFDDL